MSAIEQIELVGKYWPYPEYKDSGVEWLADVPCTWQVKRLGQYLFERRDKVSDKDYAPLSVTKNGIVPQLDSAAKTDAGDNRKLVKAGDYVINSRSDRKGSSGLSDLDGSVSLISIVLEPKGIHSRFVHHLLRSYPFQEEFYRWGKGIVADLWSTNYGEMKNISLPIPSLEEQRTIAAFLDYETARIDRLIAHQQRLIELLKEKRQALISHAVTKGLNPDAPMKNSGVEWLGQVPEHWDILPIQRLLKKIEQGSSPTAQNRAPENGEYGVLKISSVKKGVFVSEEAKTLDSITQYEHRFKVESGDLLVTRANTPSLVADACVVDIETANPIMMCDLIYRLVTTKTINNQFLCSWLLSSFGRLQIEMDARGSSMTMAKVSQGHIKAWITVRPPMQEQLEINSFLLIEKEKFSTLISKAKLAINLMQERRIALISATATGKIDLRGWKKPHA